MYNYIIDTITNKNIKLNTKKGLNILKKYINQLGGKKTIYRKKRKSQNKVSNKISNKLLKIKKLKNKLLEKQKLENKYIKESMKEKNKHINLAKVKCIKNINNTGLDWNHKINSCTMKIQTNKCKVNNVSKFNCSGYYKKK